MSLGSGIAIVGIWTSVAISVIYIGPFALPLGLFAMFATAFVAESGSSD